MPFSEYLRTFKGNHPYRTLESRWELLFDSKEEFEKAMRDLNPQKRYEWQWKWVRKENGDIYGYEVTSRGDRRYSPFFQRVVYNGEEITAEKYWELVIKPMPDKKGTAHKFLGNYMKDHPGLAYELAVIGQQQPLTDMFDKPGGQNKTYCDILNSYFNL